MKKTIPLFAVLLALALFFSGCGRTPAAQDAAPAKDEAPAAASEKQPPAPELLPQPETPPPELLPQPETPPPPPEEQPPVTALSGEELQAFTDLFDTPEYNGFLEEPFNSPADIRWDTVLRSGAGIAVKDPGEEEISDYLRAVGQKKLYGGLMAVRRSDLEAYIRKHTGIDPAPDGELPSWEYVSGRDSFYRLYWGDEHVAYTCVSGERTGGRYTLRFEVSGESAGIDPRGHYGVLADRILTMTRSGDGFVMASNAICWDDHCDAEQTFDVELPQFDGPVRFITYSVDPDESSFAIVKDGRCLTQLSTYIYADTLAYLKKIIAVGFFDFNADGMKDIAVVGDSDYGRRVLLYEAVTDEYVFSYFTDLDENELARIRADFTIGGVRAALLGENRDAVYGGWREAYAQIAKVHAIENDGYRFDLIMADDDGIPELVVGYPGYRTSLYTWEDGRVRCLMHQWPYGAGGNSGYSYVPGMGIYYNGNSDYAGAVYYETYMSKRDEGELATDFWVRTNNYVDLDGDGEPSWEEIEASGSYFGSAEYHNETGREMSEEEIRAVIERYESYEKKPLVGELDYETLLARLAA